MQAKKTNRERRRRKATTQEVIGDVKGHGQIDPKWARHYHNLMDVRMHLHSQKEELVKDELAEQPTFSQHMADAATDSFDRDLALSLISSEQDALYEIEQALSRIKQGTYGICELTGKPIERQRLNAIPWTRFSAQAERGSLKTKALWVVLGSRDGRQFHERIYQTRLRKKLDRPWLGEEVTTDSRRQLRESFVGRNPQGSQKKETGFDPGLFVFNRLRNYCRER